MNGIWLRMAILLSLSIIVYFHYVFVWWEKGSVIIGKSIQIFLIYLIWWRKSRVTTNDTSSPNQMWSNIEQTVIQCFQNIYSYRNIYITCSQMYDLLIKIDWIIMCLLLYSDLFSGSFFFLTQESLFCTKEIKLNQSLLQNVPYFVMLLYYNSL